MQHPIDTADLTREYGTSARVAGYTPDDTSLPGWEDDSEWYVTTNYLPANQAFVGYCTGNGEFVSVGITTNYTHRADFRSIA